MKEEDAGIQWLDVPFTKMAPYQETISLGALVYKSPAFLCTNGLMASPKGLECSQPRRGGQGSKNQHAPS